MKKRIFLGCGSNVGDRLENICNAVRLLSHLPHTTLLQLSSVYETEPVGKIQQNTFLNCVVEAETEEDIFSFHTKTKEIERRVGRKKREHWGPREIDIDILILENEIITSETLKIPHAEMHKRNFVLVPLVEIAPERFHPILKKTMYDILRTCSDTHAVTKSEHYSVECRLKLKDLFARTSD